MFSVLQATTCLSCLMNRVRGLKGSGLLRQCQLYKLGTLFIPSASRSVHERKGVGILSTGVPCQNAFPKWKIYQNLKLDGSGQTTQSCYWSMIESRRNQSTKSSSFKGKLQNLVFRDQIMEQRIKDIDNELQHWNMEVNRAKNPDQKLSVLLFGCKSSKDLLHFIRPYLDRASVTSEECTIALELYIRLVYNELFPEFPGAPVHDRNMLSITNGMGEETLSAVQNESTFLKLCSTFEGYLDILTKSQLVSLFYCLSFLGVPKEGNLYQQLYIILSNIDNSGFTLSDINKLAWSTLQFPNPKLTFNMLVSRKFITTMMETQDQTLNKPDFQSGLLLMTLKQYKVESCPQLIYNNSLFDLMVKHINKIMLNTSYLDDPVIAAYILRFIVVVDLQYMYMKNVHSDISFPNKTAITDKALTTVERNIDRLLPFHLGNLYSAIKWKGKSPFLDKMYLQIVDLVCHGNLSQLELGWLLSETTVEDFAEYEKQEVEKNIKQFTNIDMHLFMMHLIETKSFKELKTNLILSNLPHVRTEDALRNILKGLIVDDFDNIVHHRVQLHIADLFHTTNLFSNKGLKLQTLHYLLDAPTVLPKCEQIAHVISRELSLGLPPMYRGNVILATLIMKRLRNSFIKHQKEEAYRLNVTQLNTMLLLLKAFCINLKSIQKHENSEKYFLLTSRIVLDFTRFGAIFARSHINSQLLQKVSSEFFFKMSTIKDTSYFSKVMMLLTNIYDLGSLMKQEVVDNILEVQTANPLDIDIKSFIDLLEFDIGENLPSVKCYIQNYFDSFQLIDKVNCLANALNHPNLLDSDWICKQLENIFSEESLWKLNEFFDSGGKLYSPKHMMNTVNNFKKLNHVASTQYPQLNIPWFMDNVKIPGIDYAISVHKTPNPCRQLIPEQYRDVICSIYGGNRYIGNNVPIISHYTAGAVVLLDQEDKPVIFRHDNFLFSKELGLKRIGFFFLRLSDPIIYCFHTKRLSLTVKEALDTMGQYLDKCVIVNDLEWNSWGNHAMEDKIFLVQTRVYENKPFTGNFDGMEDYLVNLEPGFKIIDNIPKCKEFDNCLY